MYLAKYLILHIKYKCEQAYFTLIHINVLHSIEFYSTLMEMYPVINRTPCITVYWINVNWWTPADACCIISK